MDITYFRTLFDFHYWARDRMMHAVSALTPEQYTESVGGSFGSVRDTLNHTYGAEVLWLRRWQGESPTGFPKALPQSVEELTEAWRAHEALMRSYLDALGDGDLSRSVVYRNLAGVQGESLMWEMLAHVVNHATYHRGQVTTLLRLLGATPPDSTDLIGYFRVRHRPTT